MAFTNSLLHLLVLLLAFSHLLCLNAIPLTRTRNLMHASQENEAISEKIHLGKTEKKWEGRMNVELHDYPGSGANNRHTPKHCADC